jgi:hypothetical protein
MPPRPPRSQSRFVTRLRWTAFGFCAVLATLGALLGLRSPMLHQYEYQEDVYVGLDASATVYVSASLPALVALHGFDLPTSPSALVDRTSVRRQFAGPGVTVGSMSLWRRHGRRFVTVRLDVRDIRRLPASRAFANDTFEFGRAGAGFRLAERLGPWPTRPIPEIGWDGSEMVGFRWHIPSRIEVHNTRAEDFLRGNILVWEQPLAARLAGTPLEMKVRMEGRTILYSALWLFATSVASAVVVVGLVVWWIMTRGRGTGRAGRQDAPARGHAPPVSKL